MYEILGLKHVFSTFQETIWSHLNSCHVGKARSKVSSELGLSSESWMSRFSLMKGLAFTLLSIYWQYRLTFYISICNILRHSPSPSRQPPPAPPKKKQLTFLCIHVTEPSFGYHEDIRSYDTMIVNTWNFKHYRALRLKNK